MGISTQVSRPILPQPPRSQSNSRVISVNVNMAASEASAPETAADDGTKPFDDANISVIAIMGGGDPRTIPGLALDTSLRDLRAAVAHAFGIPASEVKLLSAHGAELPIESTLGATGMEDGAHVIVARVESDTFDGDMCRCEHGMEVSDGGRTVTKTGGADLTTCLGKAVIEGGTAEWNIRVVSQGGNLMIGIMQHEAVPLGFAQKEWIESRCGSAPTLPHVGQLWFVKSRGNTTRLWGEWSFDSPDVITVVVDLHAGTVLFKRNGCQMEQEESSYPWSGVQGPLSLFVNMDYNNDCVTICEP